MNIERWTGFYLGGTVGGARGMSDLTGDLGEITLRQRGAVGTIHAGYNWQIGSAALVGLEADLGTGGLGGTVTTPSGNSLSTDLKAMGSLRARAGFLVTPALLVYATGGFAWADTEFKLATGANTSKWSSGHQLGLGTELKLAPNWSVRLEYIYTNLEKSLVGFSGTTAARVDPDFHTVRAGVSFKF
jgi:outer membrane immunogenic protein